MLSKYISLPIFLISFAVGLFFIYVIGPEMKTIYIYPNPDNYNKYLYKDTANQCFEIKPVETSCGILNKDIPLQ